MNEIVIIRQFNTLATGKTVTVTGRIELERRLWLDGHEDTVPCCEMRVDVQLEGVGSMGSHIQPLTADEKKRCRPGFDYTHRVDRLALTKDQVELIQSVKRDLERHPAWVQRQAQIAENRRAAAELEAQRRNHPGWCDKCHSYCYGDCEA